LKTLGAAHFWQDRIGQEWGESVTNRGSLATFRSIRTRASASDGPAFSANRRNSAPSVPCSGPVVGVFVRGDLYLDENNDGQPEQRKNRKFGIGPIRG